MRERPILFNGAMVRAILSGAKSQTRRAVKVPLAFEFIGGSGDDRNNPANWGAEDEDGRWWALASGPSTDHVLPCPFGQPGDQLWVRETTQVDRVTSDSAELARYSADQEPVCYPLGTGNGYDGAWQLWWYSRDTCPNIHMPRKACRLVLEITDVRVERLQAISEADAAAEGIIEYDMGDRPAMYGTGYPDSDPNADSSPRGAFQKLWQSTGGDWDANPWVWVISFRRLP